MVQVTAVARLSASALVAAVLLACSGKSADNGDESGGPGDYEPPTYQRSPILVPTLNGPAYILSVEAPSPLVHNSLPQVTELSPSPSRRSVFLKSLNGSAAHLFALEPNGRQIELLPSGSTLLGWTSDDELLLILSTGLFRISSDGASRRELPFPIERLRDGVALSPDGSVFVFGEFGDSTRATGLQFVDSNTGEMLERWPVSNVGPLHWAADGTVALTPYNGNSIILGTREGFTTHPLPFQPCRIMGRVDPGLLEVWERIGDPATNTSCGVPWLIRTDGTIVGEDTEGRPAAFSPDRKKLLLLDTDLTVTDLDRQNPQPLAHIEQVWGVAW